MSVEQNACKNPDIYCISISFILISVIKNVIKKCLEILIFQDYWLTDPSFKLWLRKCDDKTAFCSYCQKKIDVSNGGESVLKQHAGLAPFKDKGKNHKLRTPVAGRGSLLGHLKKPESEEVTNEEKN